MCFFVHLVFVIFIFLYFYFQYNRTTLMLWLGTDYEASMSQAEKALGWWRTGLKDMWNIHGKIILALPLYL